MLESKTEGNPDRFDIYLNLVSTLNNRRDGTNNTPHNLFSMVLRELFDGQIKISVFG